MPEHERGEPGSRQEAGIDLLRSNRVLCFNHTGLVSGAERSMLELVSGLDAADGVDVVAAAPAGPLHDHLERLGVERAVARGTEVSFEPSVRGGVRIGWDIVVGGFSLARLARRGRVDLVHANSPRAGLIAAAARVMGGPRVVVHVRDVLPESRLGRLVGFVLRRGARRLVAISDHVGRGLPGAVTVLNPVDVNRFSPEAADPSRVREELGLDPEQPVLGVFGQITKWKGQDTAIAALGLIRDAFPSAVLLIVGEAKFVGERVRFDNRAFLAEIEAAAAELPEGAVRFLGEREDVPSLMAACTAVLVPSWEEPFGRTVVEAMAVGRVVIATSVGGPAEVITPGVDGLLVSPRDPALWAGAIAGVLSDPAERARMGEAARITAQRYDRSHHVDRMLEVYAEVLA